MLRYVRLLLANLFFCVRKHHMNPAFLGYSSENHPSQLLPWDKNKRMNRKTYLELQDPVKSKERAAKLAEEEGKYIHRLLCSKAIHSLCRYDSSGTS